MKKDRTLDEIRTDGLDALRKRLGVAGMVRFLQQFENGSGDYASGRRRWAAKMSFNDIRADLASSRRKSRKAG